MFGLLGKSLSHSISPWIHEMLGNPSYKLYETDDPSSIILEKSFQGLNVTIPYKHDCVQLCDVLSASVNHTGVCNTIVNTQGTLYAHNTDYDALHTIISHSFPLAKDISIAIIGNGATAQTLFTVLSELHYQSVTIYARHPINDEQSLSTLQDATHHQMIINTTPVGMHPMNSASLPLELSRFSSLIKVVDLIYNPLQTKLLLNAKALGIDTMNGLPMLVLQAFYADRLFRPNAVQTLSYELLYKNTLKKMINIVLIGLSFSGKSTTAPFLATHFDKTLIDIDATIENHTNMSIPDLFASSGEKVFRQHEHAFTVHSAKQSNQVIATGAGVIENSAAVDALKQTSIMIYLDINPHTLDASQLTHRPKIQSINDLLALKQKRAPLYSDAADIVIQTHQKTISQIVQEIEVKFHAYIDHQWTQLKLPRNP